MLQHFTDYLSQQHLLPDGGEVLLAVSGGRDSVCMAHLFHRAAIPFAIAHCNFYLRPGDCDRDQQFVRQLADTLGVTFFTTDFDTRRFAADRGMGIEEAARTLRYDYFAQLCLQHGFACVATAHHRDDSIETFFLNLFRGTGIAGLHGIRPLSTLGDMLLVRPMLCFSRADIDDYVRRHGLDYVEDVTNGQLNARRNRIRLQLMPLLRELYPSVDATMVDNMERLQQVETVYNLAINDLRHSLLHTSHSPFGFKYTWLDIASLPPLYPLSTLSLGLLHPFGFTPSTVADMVRAMRSGQTGARFLAPDYVAVLDRNRLVVADRRSLPPAPTVQTVPLAPSDVPPFGERHGVEYIDADLVHAPLSVRHWRHGDRFCPLGMHHQRRLSDFLKDSKINLIEKDCVHVLVDADDRIVWVIGLRLDHRFRVTSATRRVLRLSVSPAPLA